MPLNKKLKIPLNFMMYINKRSNITKGVITVITNNETETEKVQPAIITKKDYVLIAISGIVGAIIVWYKIRDIGWVSYLIGCMSGLLIITLSILMIEESNE